MTWTRLLLFLGVLLHLAVMAPSAERVWKNAGGADYASYHYATKVAATGGDPYATEALGAAARAERTRKGVHPYFYPPPFLLGTAWSLPLSLRDGYRFMFVLNEVALLGVLAVCVRCFAMPAWAALVLLAAYTPIPDNAKMGQANLLVLLPALAGLALATRPSSPTRRARDEVLGGVLLGVAGMAKMSPALFLVGVAMAGRWRAFVAAGLTAVALSILALPLVGVDAQVRFYAEVLPGFARGQYHDLSVPIGLPSNHSIPNLWFRLLDEGARTTLSPMAQRLGTLSMLGLLGAWAARAGLLARRARRIGGDVATTVLSPALLGALGVILVVTPAYTYEHHLVLLIPALGAAAGQIRGRDGALLRGRVALLAGGFALLAMPLPWFDLARGLPGLLGDVAQEMKTLGMLLLLGLLLAWADVARGEDPAPNPSG